jgi:methyltransferase-like protein/ubiquinone/menaquinone biosynthesis C-methylase UbiE
MQKQASTYDSVLYPSYTHPQTHPERLAVVGAAMGLRPAPPGRSRVLELGCGNGANLIPMACGLPESEFVGIDLAARPIAFGKGMIEDLGLANIRLLHGSITDISADWGKFDYLIAHGLYSWVPPDIQRHLLTLCREFLAPQGIAFVSYNALPGGHLRNMLREMMLFHTRGFESAEERVKQAMAFVRFLAEAHDSDDPYRVWLRSEFDGILAHSEGHLYHDELAELNEPLYFTQFIERAAAHELQYLAEADYFEMFAYGFNMSTRQTLERLGANRIAREQYLDFLKCRRFRQTLLCHREVCLSNEPRPEIIEGFLISSLAECKTTPLNLNPGVNMLYQTPKGAKCETDFPLGKAALAVLGEIGPMPFSFDELLSQAHNRLREAGIRDESNGPIRERFSSFLLQLYSAGVVELRAGLAPITRTVSDRPVASALARWQAQHGDVATTAFHIAVKLEDEIGRSLLMWLDGTQDRKALVEKIWRLLESRKALVVPAGGETAARQDLAQKLEKNLEKLAGLGLLVG